MTDDLVEAVGHHSHPLAQVPDSEITTVALVAAKYFQNHHEQAFCILQALGYLSGRLSFSRFNRRLHHLADWLDFMAVTVGKAFAHGEMFVIDSLPIPVCQRARARRCRKVRGRAFCGYCVAKKQKFLGWRLHLIWSDLECRWATREFSTLRRSEDLFLLTFMCVYDTINTY